MYSIRPIFIIIPTLVNHSSAIGKRLAGIYHVVDDVIGGCTRLGAHFGGRIGICRCQSLLGFVQPLGGGIGHETAMVAITLNGNNLCDGGGDRPLTVLTLGDDVRLSFERLLIEVVDRAENQHFGQYFALRIHPGTSGIAVYIGTANLQAVGLASAAGGSLGLFLIHVEVLFNQVLLYIDDGIIQFTIKIV